MSAAMLSITAVVATMRATTLRAPPRDFVSALASNREDRPNLRASRIPSMVVNVMTPRPPTWIRQMMTT